MRSINSEHAISEEVISWNVIRLVCIAVDQHKPEYDYAQYKQSIQIGFLDAIFFFQSFRCEVDRALFCVFRFAGLFVEKQTKVIIRLQNVTVTAMTSPGVFIIIVMAKIPGDISVT